MQKRGDGREGGLTCDVEVEDFVDVDDLIKQLSRIVIYDENLPCGRSDRPDLVKKAYKKKRTKRRRGCELGDQRERALLSAEAGLTSFDDVNE